MSTFAEVLLSRDRDPYPPPPRVHWTILLALGVILYGLIDGFAPRPFRDIWKSLAADAWVFYLCVWIRKLDHEALSPFLCDAYVVIELAFAAAGIWQSPSPAMRFFTGTLGVLSAVLGIVTIYWVRADLQKHYNDREDFKLVLDPVMTLFFSFVYFQYHLYDIAAQKQEERQSDAPY